MELDWLTITAQVINFLILVWLLQRFLYEPIRTAMTRREERIEARLADARESREAAEEEARKLRDKQQEIESDREFLMDAARKEADELREKLEKEVGQDIEKKRSAWKKRLEEERAGFAKNFGKTASQQVIKTVRSILSDFADADLAARVADEFMDRLDTLREEDLRKLNDAAARAKEAALIESGVELPAAARRRITLALHNKLRKDLKVDYGISADLLLGMRLTVGEQTVEWSARQYLGRLEDMVDEAIETSAAKGKPG